MSVLKQVHFELSRPPVPAKTAARLPGRAAANCKTCAIDDLDAPDNNRGKASVSDAHREHAGHDPEGVGP